MDFLNNLFTYKNNIVVQGLTDELSVQYMYNNFKQNDENMLVVTASMYEANKFFQTIKLYNENDNIIIK